MNGPDGGDAHRPASTTVPRKKKARRLPRVWGGTIMRGTSCVREKRDGAAGREGWEIHTLSLPPHICGSVQFNGNRPGHGVQVCALAKLYFACKG
eukprot:363267-Chlamydomonas_euryale.AAC.4